MLPRRRQFDTREDEPDVPTQGVQPVHAGDEVMLWRRGCRRRSRAGGVYRAPGPTNMRNEFDGHLQSCMRLKHQIGVTCFMRDLETRQ
jgi:hypothetical protein